MNQATTILFVDDDPVLLESVTDLLRLSGYQVLNATHGAQALEVMQSQMPDLIVSDVTMQTMDGHQFYRAVRQNPAWTTIPFIFLSARVQQADIREGTRLGADYYLTKPFDPDDLLVAIESRLERVRQIQSAAQAREERMKQQLMTVFGHELRTPLSYIYGYVSLLQDDHPNMDQAEMDQMLATIRHGSERLMRLVEDLLLMARIDGGAVAMEIQRYRKPTELAPQIDEVLQDFSLKAKARQITIEADVPLTLIANCEGAYFKNTFARVIDNAIKFSKSQGGRIWIAAEEQDGKVVIKVRDNGIGIPADQVEHIFERFQQVDREIMEQQGIGLGLTIAYCLIELHGGSLTVDSKLGEGTLLRLTLPA